MNDLITSYLRTAVPVIVGAVVGFLATKGIDVDDNAVAGLTAFLSGLSTAVYYGLVRLVETKYPKAGWLLGTPKKPEYGAKA